MSWPFRVACQQLAARPFKQITLQALRLCGMSFIGSDYVNLEHDSDFEDRVTINKPEDSAISDAQDNCGTEVKGEA
jgi:hypothetical protein